MNIINVKVNFEKGTCETTGINLITGDYNSTKMIFNFDRDTGTKVFEMKSPSEQLVMVQEIQNNEVILYGLDEDENIASIFNEEGYYIFEISLYENESKLTSAKGKIKVKPEQVIIDGEVVEAYLPIFDQLLSQVNTAITQTNNLNITGSKVDTTSTIIITHKDGTTTTLSVLDGEQGPQGEPGVPGAVKYKIVQTLPTEDIETDAIYLVPSEEPTTQDLYLEYMYINNQWELLGQKQIVVDLTDYVKFTDYATPNTAGVMKVTNGGSGFIVRDGFLRGYSHNYQTYVNAGTDFSIAKGTLENVITGKGLTTKSYVDGLVGDIQTLLDDLDSGSGV